MIKLAKLAWGAIVGRRDWLTLLAVASAAAALYAWGASARLERDRAIAWGDQICAAAGVLRDVEAGRKVAQGICARRIADLARFERESQAASARLLADHVADQARKSARDAAQARADASAARAAAEQMERENGKITNDRVGGSWFDALNRLAGLRNDQR